MGRLQRQLDDLTVRAVSPDGRIRVLVKGRAVPRVAFTDHDDYAAYPDGGALASQVAVALQRATEAAEEARRAAVARLSRLKPNNLHWNADRRRMYEEINGTAVEGRSGFDDVRVTRTGMTGWTVGIRPGSLSHMTAADFCSQVNQAIQDADRGYLAMMRTVKTRAMGALGPR